ncbi:hypothetical protein [Rhizobium halophilum]|uniref:hypothetical protein n=1 Tax=Rhizobium halophilum TaxID=2846852 RepID=UPI001EFE3008|nr:hypothetical protein [Rhizobium halophilum]MCF6368305.1 hypothetical protein [Rhizobium halophilum]
MQKIILNIVEPFISLLDQLGLKEPLRKWAGRAWLWLTGAAMSSLLVAWNTYLYLWGLIPWWAVPLFVILNIALVVVVFLALTWLGIKTVNAWFDTRKRVTAELRIKEWAEKIERDCLEMAEYYQSLADANDLYQVVRDERGMPDHDSDRALRKKIADKFYVRFAGRLLANQTLLEQLGIQLPWHFRHAANDQPRTLVVFHSHVASLLRQGYIKEATSIKDREGFELIESLTR